MPVASSIIAAGIGAVGSIAASALAPKGKDAARIGAEGQRDAALASESGKWGDRFSGIMAGTSKSLDTDAVSRVNQQGSGPLGGLTRENLGSLAEKYPDNPAYKLAIKADEIFKPDITQVED